LHDFELGLTVPYRLSGLIIDVFGDVAVVASSAAWVEKYKSEIEACLGKINYINHINWRPSVDILKEDGVNESELKEMPPSTCPERTKVCNDQQCNFFLYLNLGGRAYVVLYGKG